MSGQPVENPNILLINQPGCLVLQEIVEKLSIYLKSHGANVKIMFENDGLEIDHYGGVSTYLTRNVPEHHFVLMLFTDTFKGTLLSSNLWFALVIVCFGVQLTINHE